jgi:MFS family permease
MWGPRNGPHTPTRSERPGKAVPLLDTPCAETYYTGGVKDELTVEHWILLAATMAIVGAGSGALFSLGVFLEPIEKATAWSRTDISAVALLTWVTYGVGSFLWGMLSGRSGVRAVVVTGGFLLGLGLVLSSRATMLWQFAVAFGGLVGLAVGAFYAPLTTTASNAFKKHRGLAIGLVAAGSGLGTFTIAPLTRWLISQYDWRIAMLLLGDLAWLTIIPLALIVREKPTTAASVPTVGAHRDREPDLSLFEVARAPQFWLIALTHFTCCLAHSGPIFHMVANATDHRIAPMAAAAVFGVSGLVSIAGRIGSGMIADRLGAKRTLIVMLSLQAPAILLYVFAGGSTSFYVIGMVFGLAYGGVMPLYALLTREYFGARAMGGAYGAIFMLQAIGMGLGTFAGGWLYDRLGGYGWLFASAAAVGAAAVIIALALRAPRTALHTASPAAA